MISRFYLRILSLTSTFLFCTFQAIAASEAVTFADKKLKLEYQAKKLKVESEEPFLTKYPDEDLPILQIVREGLAAKGKELQRGYYGVIHPLNVKGKEYIIKSLIQPKGWKSYLRGEFNFEEQLASEVAPFHFLPPHPNLVSYHGSFYCQGAWHMVLEKGECDLFSVVTKKVPEGKDPVLAEISVEEAQRIKLHLILGLMHLHDQGLYHGDLKPDNIIRVVSEPQERVYKLIDFSTLAARDSKPFYVYAENTYLPQQEVAICHILSLFFHGKSIDKTLNKSLFEFSRLCSFFSRVLGKEPAKSAFSFIIARLKKTDSSFAKGNYSSEYFSKNWHDVLWDYYQRYDARAADIFSLGHLFNLLNQASKKNSQKIVQKTREGLLNPDFMKRMTIDEVLESFKKGEI